jgi:hypothetical protein
MSKISDFYAKATADETSKNELIAILGDKKLTEASDEQLVKVGELAKKIGFEITIDEAKAYLNGGDELDEDDLDAVAGGKGSGGNTTIGTIECKNGVGYGTIDVSTGLL